MEKIKTFLGRWWIVLVLVALIPVYSIIALNNERRVDYVNNGFFAFWLAGHMQWTGENPYSAVDWTNGHQAFGSTWIPEPIFGYPLPLALVTAPLGLFPVKQAYILWDVLAQLMIAGCIVWLASHWSGLNRQLYAVFVLVAAILNGNIFLGLMTGTFAAVYLVFLTLSLYFMEKNRPWLAGVLLAGLALKPPLLAVTAMIGLWLLMRRNWKAIAGIGLGGVGLLITGLFMDAGWLGKFREVSGTLLDKRLGNQPTIPSYTRLLCGGEMSCAFITYALAAALLVALFAWLVWKKRESLSPMMAYSAAIVVGVLLPPYLWSYDYGLLVIPVCYVVFELIRQRESYVLSTIFLLVFDAISIIGLVLFWINPESNALTIQRDMWSIWVALLALAATWWMVLRASPEPAETEG